MTFEICRSIIALVAMGMCFQGVRQLVPLQSESWLARGYVIAGIGNMGVFVHLAGVLLHAAGFLKHAEIMPDYAMKGAILLALVGFGIVMWCGLPREEKRQPAWWEHLQH